MTDGQGNNEQGQEHGQGDGSALDGGAGANVASFAGASAGADGAGGNAGSAANWMLEQLSPTNREALASKDWANPDAMAESYLNLEKTVGAKGVSVPGESATDEDWSNFYDQLGRPKEATDYTFAMPEGVEAKPSDLAYQKAMAPALHEAGLTQRQVDIMGSKHEFRAFL